MSDFQKLTDELLQDAEFKKEYEALQPERDITMSLIQVRKEAELAQAKLSRKTETSQADIRRHKQ